MTAYQPEDLEGYEFKILRSTTARFGKPDALRGVLAEEAEAGWELVEKFDDHRIRLKRTTAWREKDAHLPRDPYRTWVGVSDNRLALVIAGILIALVALAGLLATILR